MVSSPSKSKASCDCPRQQIYHWALPPEERRRDALCRTGSNMTRPKMCCGELGPKVHVRFSAAAIEGVQVSPGGWQPNLELMPTLQTEGPPCTAKALVCPDHPGKKCHLHCGSRLSPMLSVAPYRLNITLEDLGVEEQIRQH